MANKIPTTMRAAVIDSFGGPEVLKLGTVPVPELDPEEVLIAVHTAGVGSWDADIRRGWWPQGRPWFPIILGTDGSGNVAAALENVARIPRRLDVSKAGAIPTTGLTALQGVDDALRIKREESVIIH